MRPIRQRARRGPSSLCSLAASAAWLLLTLAWMPLAMCPAPAAPPDPLAVERDSYSMPATFTPRDFLSLSRVFVQPGDSTWQAENYVFADVARVTHDGEEWVRWHFARKADGLIPSLGYRNAARVAPENFSVRVLNKGAEPIALSAWGENAPEQATIVQPGEERVVTLRGITSIVAQGTKQGVEYEVYLRELTINYPTAKGVKAARVEGPARLVVGEQAEFSVALEGDLAGRFLTLEVRQDPYVMWRIVPTDEELQQLAAGQALVLRREVPWYLPPGDVTFGATADAARMEGAEGAATVVNEHAPGLPMVERREHNGRPTYFVDGEPFIWSGYATYFNVSPAAITEFADSGANLFHIPCAPGRHFHNIAAPTWLGGDEYDFGEVDQWATTILQANPDAKIILRLALGLPPFWFADHPDSRVRVRTTDGLDIAYKETDSEVATLTSEAWREQQAVALRKLLQHCAAQPWASQVIGVNLGGGMTEEWFAWGSCHDIVTPVRIFSDYSPANQQAFRAWCAKKGLPFTEIPAPTLRVRPGHDLFPDDEAGRWAAAYNAFINDTNAETLLYFADVVKDETERHTLVGAFFGYVVLLTGEARQSTSGMFGVRHALESEDIDFLGGVPLFTVRYFTGVGYAGQPTAIESLLAHGKQYADDNDLFSWLHEAHWHTEYDEADPRGAAIEMHRRWLASEAVRGNSTEWFSLSPKWHRDDELMADYGKQARVLLDSINVDRTPTEEVAFVVDDTSFAWLTPESQAQYPVQLLLGALGRTGAPLGTWLMSDLDRLPERIKFVVVTNASAARDEDLAKLRALIEKGGRTIMLVGTPGLVDEKTWRWDATRMEALLGLPIRLDEGLHTGRASLAKDGTMLSTMAPPVEEVMQGHDRDPVMMNPRAHLDGEGFMTYEDGKVAGGERPLAGGGRLVWCGASPYASEAWLREQLLQAGVHCYAPAPCSVHASRGLVAITSVFAEDRDIELAWPADVVVTDVLNDWRGEGKTMTVPFAKGQTRLFRVEPR